MTNRERIERAVYAAVDDLNRQLPSGVSIAKSPDTFLLGDSQLESLDFLTFVMDVESNIKKEFEVEIVLTNENLLSEQRSPFRTIGTLIAFLEGDSRIRDHDFSEDN